MLLPDSLVLKVVGHVIQHNCLIAMAYNNDIIVRTAVVRVSEFPPSLSMPTLSVLSGAVWMYIGSEQPKMITCDHYSVQCGLYWPTPSVHIFLVCCSNVLQCT